MLRPFPACALLAAVALASGPGPTPGHARQPDPPAQRSSGLMRPEFVRLADEIKRFLAARNERAVAVGTFTGPAQMPSSSGPGLAQVLKEELERVGVAVKRDAKVALFGSYRPLEKEEPAKSNVLAADKT